ncbi:MAG TPA: hypothetical protein DEB06_06115 [Phycisphaerales bacterium]|nr:hypothetical protein [Phycisphaerales bacterium]
MLIVPLVPFFLVWPWDQFRRLQQQVRLAVIGLGYPLCFRCGGSRPADAESACPACGAASPRYHPTPGSVVFDDLCEMPELLLFDSENEALKEYRSIELSLGWFWMFRAPLLLVIAGGLSFIGVLVWTGNIPRRVPAWLAHGITFFITMIAFSIPPIYLLAWSRRMRAGIIDRLVLLGRCSHPGHLCGACGHDLAGLVLPRCPACDAALPHASRADEAP